MLGSRKLLQALKGQRLARYKTLGSGYFAVVRFKSWGLKILA